MLRVFEAFAGYGSQRMALRNIGIEFEVVGISEIDGDVIQSYAVIHSDFLKKREHIDNHVPESKEEMISYLVNPHSTTYAYSFFLFDICEELSSDS